MSINKVGWFNMIQHTDNGFGYLHPVLCFLFQ